MSIGGKPYEYRVNAVSTQNESYRLHTDVNLCKMLMSEFLIFDYDKLRKVSDFAQRSADLYHRLKVYQPRSGDLNEHRVRTL